MAERLNPYYLVQMLNAVAADATYLTILAPPEEWRPNEAYPAMAYVRPATWNGYVYRTTSPGTSGSSEPAWPSDIGQTVIDNDITWECVEFPATYDSAMLAQIWVPSVTYNVGNLVRASSYNGYVYRCIQAGTSGSSEPVWPEVEGNQVNDGTVVWEAVRNWAVAGIDITGLLSVIEDGYAVTLNIPDISEITNVASAVVKSIAFLDPAHTRIVLVYDITTMQTVLAEHMSLVQAFTHTEDARIIR
ncbi:carbohydrate-binding protein [Thermodesulforhabdus norvegica]|uniref:Uncharacterized protein n=1 Tax=Thermodesulforhabdus norvegica TaxID=39841 RepID=A0A1I4SVK4_9BACT|nr:carbohydrate-binding protein [Thermodesulforhabdus norvegica]SFM68435.1 hypothetical protein SAMN05660836_01187 [Thermodesulforhabdus norvegica]